ncbi:hypothetical protein MMC12_002443 [Toensbergia leucococca]|nr:hypothetical protein [Toensbergia leucococca]
MASNVPYSYYEISNEESCDEKPNDGQDDPLLHSRKTRPPKSVFFYPRLSCNPAGGILLLFGCIVAVLSTVLWMNWLQHHNNGLARATSFYSPIFGRLDLPLHNRLTDATMFPSPTNASHIYRLPPSPEVDAAWDRISHIGVHPVTHDDVVKLGKNPDYAIMPPEDWGLDSHYMVEIEIFHQIHCLNALRKGLATNYDYYWGQKWGLDPPVMFSTHLNHCTDMLLQSLMCHADLDPITYVWREGQDKPFPDFGTWKVCRDFEAVLQWQERVQMPDLAEKWKGVVKPADARQMPAIPELHELGMGVGGEGGNLTAPLPGLGYCERE